MSSDTRILSKIIKHIQETEVDPLTPLIDEYLIKRENPKYRHKRLKHYSFDVLPRVRPLGRLSPSTVGGCQRQAAFTFMGVEGQKKLNPDTELIFEDGNWRHHKWQYIFKEMEQILGRHRFRLISIEEGIKLRKLHIAGSLDAHIRIKIKGKWQDFIVDFKGANNWAFDYVYRNRAPKPEHVWQCIPYMRAKKVNKGLVLYDSKERNVFYVFQFDMTDELWNHVRQWSKRVLRQIDKQQIPPMHPDCDKGNFLGDKCPFRGWCYGTKDDDEIEEEVFRNFSSVEELWEEGWRQVALARKQEARS